MIGTQLSAANFAYHTRPFSITGLLWSAWLHVPSSIRLAAYRALWLFSEKRSGPTSSFSRVMRLVPFNLYAKQGFYVTVHEALAPQYIAEHTTISVPRMLDVIELAHGEGNFLLMTAVKGREYGPTGVLLDVMPESQRAAFTETLRGWFDQLRRLQPPDDHTISGFMLTGVMSFRIAHPSLVGPFASQDEFHAQHFCQPFSTYHDELSTALDKRAKTQYKICFTHGDITPHNILVDENLRPCALIDWECAGWMPEYWEYTVGRYTYVQATLDGRMCLQIFFRIMRQSL
ncbi:kinase-like domain-containing protein [Pholiota molesta]|nr:kinase-like domain-containing protein [Pholiota molesta]